MSGINAISDRKLDSFSFFFPSLFLSYSDSQSNTESNLIHYPLKLFAYNCDLIGCEGLVSFVDAIQPISISSLFTPEKIVVDQIKNFFVYFIMY